jgi:hypothetical protein
LFQLSYRRDALFPAPHRPNHDAKVAAAQTALMEHKCLNRDHAIDETLQFESSSPTHQRMNNQIPLLMVLSKAFKATHQENLRTTALAADLLAACPAANARPGRLPPGRLPPEEVGRMRSEFRLFAFETGRQYYDEGTLDNIKLSTVFKAFEKKVAPDQVPPSLKSGINVETWKKAVRANDIDMLAMSRSVPDVQKVHIIKKKLAIRSDMTYLIEWCMGWMKTDRAAG